jgi:hypothetical protein
MVTAFAARLYWPCWVFATILTGIVAGFMLGHALILARFLDWLLASGTPALGLQYPAFRATAGRGGLAAYYAVCGLQVIAVFGFFALAVLARRARGVAAVAAVGGLWVVVHYASGFGALEAKVLKATGEVDRVTVSRFLGLNVPIHFVHAATLTTAFGALLSVPLSALRRKD